MGDNGITIAPGSMESVTAAYTTAATQLSERASEFNARALGGVSSPFGTSPGGAACEDAYQQCCDAVVRALTADSDSCKSQASAVSTGNVDFANTDRAPAT